MSEHFNTSCCGGSPGPIGPEQETDPAAKSLSDALRVSFRLLKLIMVLMVVAFIMTGLETVGPNQTAIIKVFGRVVRTSGSGLTFNWPFPVGEIELVDVSEQTVSVKDFWMFETPTDISKLLSDRRPKGEGLRPLWDGSLLTGDRYLLHVKMECAYKVTDPRAFRQQVRDKYERVIPGTMDTVQEVVPASELVRAAVRAAAIRAAATLTADGLMGGDRRIFAANTQDWANESLSESGLTVTRLDLDSPTWPLRARRDYLAAQTAAKEADSRKQEARGKAGEILRECAGERTYQALVGNPEASIAADSTGDGGLIGKYTDAREGGRDEEAKRLLEEIDNLLANKAEGEVKGVIAPAQSYRTKITEDVKGRADSFHKLLADYEKSPDFFIARHWATAREEILGAKDTEKFYMPPGKEKIVIYLGRDPEVTRQKLREQLKADPGKKNNR